MNNDLTNQKIKDTYGQVVQIISGSFYDLLGNPITNINLTSSHALTASYTNTDDFVVYAIALGGL